MLNLIFTMCYQYLSAKQKSISQTIPLNSDGDGILDTTTGQKSPLQPDPPQYWVVTFTASVTQTWVQETLTDTSALTSCREEVGQDERVESAGGERSVMRGRGYTYTWLQEGRHLMTHLCSTTPVMSRRTGLTGRLGVDSSPVFLQGETQGRQLWGCNYWLIHLLIIVLNNHLVYNTRD